MEHTVNNNELDILAHRIAESGTSAHEADIAVIVAAACATEVPSAVLAVLSDETAPPVARARAFGITASWLSRPTRTFSEAQAVRGSEPNRRPGTPMIRAASPSLTVV